MHLKTVAAGLAFASAAWLAVPAAQAAPLAQTPIEMRADTLIEKVQPRRFCRRWYRECRWRWGGGWRFRRCMRRRGC